MKRPIGLILSAIVLGLATLLLLLMTALTAFAAIFSGRQPSIATSPHWVIYLMLAVSIFYAALAVWGILTVIGILRLRSWARYSILIIGGGLAVFNVIAIFGTLLSRTMLPTLQAQQPAVDPNIMSIVFVVLTVIYLLVAMIGIWWLIYFNLRSIRELFSNPAMLVQSSSSAVGKFSRVPTAIMIIGCLLIFSAASCLICALLPFPAFLMGFILPPAVTHVFYLCLAALFAFMGYGLLRLKESARLLTIAFLIWGSCNILMAALPWYQAKFRLYMAQMFAAMPAIPGQPKVLFPYSSTVVLISCIWCLIFYGVIFWLLHRHRGAFQTAVPPQPMLEV